MRYEGSHKHNLQRFLKVDFEFLSTNPLGQGVPTSQIPLSGKFQKNNVKEMWVKDVKLMWAKMSN